MRRVRLAKLRVSADRTERKLSDIYKEENRLRYYLKNRQPKVWEDICNGIIIFDQYDHYKKLMKEEQKQRKNID